MASFTKEYGMLKQKAGVVISTYEGTDVDWGVITGMALREGLHAFQSGKNLMLIIQQYFTILFPPCTIHAPAARPGRRCLKGITTSTWNEDSSSRQRPRLPGGVPLLLGQLRHRRP